MDLEQVAAPSQSEIENIVSVQALKDNLRIRHSAQDQLLLEAIRDAYAFLDGRDGWLGRAILTQQWTLRLSEFADKIELPFPPLASVQTVKYRDTAGVLQTLDSSVYVVVPAYVGYVTLAPEQQWPDIQCHPRAVEISFTAGYGAGAVVPRQIGRAIKFLASHLYENPSATYAEPRIVMVDRKIEYGLEAVVGMMRIPHDHR